MPRLDVTAAPFSRVSRQWLLRSQTFLCLFERRKTFVENGPSLCIGNSGEDRTVVYESARSYRAETKCRVQGGEEKKETMMKKPVVQGMRLP